MVDLQKNLCDTAEIVTQATMVSINLYIKGKIRKANSARSDYLDVKICAKRLSFV